MGFEGVGEAEGVSSFLRGGEMDVSHLSSPDRPIHSPTEGMCAESMRDGLCRQ